MRKVTLTEDNIWRFRDLTCKRCGREFQVGDTFIETRSNNRRTKYCEDHFYTEPRRET